MEKKIVRSKRISWKKFGDEIMIFDDQAGTYFCLNAKAAIVWNSLDLSKTRGEIIEIMEEKLQLRSKKHREKLQKLVDDMISKQYIVFHDEEEVI